MDAARADLSRTWALVPIRGLETAKSRLGGDLDAEERLELVTELLRRTLVATRDARRIDGTVVVTMDGAAAELAQANGALGLVERAPGLNEAIAAARSLAVARGATAVLVLPADLPAVSAGALDSLVAEAADTPHGWGDRGVDAALVALVPDRHGAGTNALLLSPPDAIEPAFGADSRVAHQKAARATAARFAELESPLSIDVDTSADLAAAEAVLGSIRG
jgi:2-phospho-L-lactate/phosphoenolpyruvate guanylyltransferase